MQLRYIEDLAQGQETPLLAIAVADGASATEAYLSAIDSVLRGGVEAVMTAGDVTFCSVSGRLMTWTRRSSDASRAGRSVSPNA